MQQLPGLVCSDGRRIILPWKTNVSRCHLAHNYCAVYVVVTLRYTHSLLDNRYTHYTADILASCHIYWLHEAHCKNSLGRRWNTSP